MFVCSDGLERDNYGFVGAPIPPPQPIPPKTPKPKPTKETEKKSKFFEIKFANKTQKEPVDVHELDREHFAKSGVPLVNRAEVLRSSCFLHI